MRKTKRVPETETGCNVRRSSCKNVKVVEHVDFFLCENAFSFLSPVFTKNIVMKRSNIRFKTVANAIFV